MATLERLTVLIEANTKSYENAMKRLQQQTEKAIRASSKSVDSLDGRLKSFMGTATKLAGVLGVGLSAGAFVNFIKKSIEAGSEIGDFANRLGITAEEFQEFSYAASQAGGSQEAFVKAITGMTKLLGEAARGSKTARAELAALGVSLADLAGKTPTQAFEMLMDRISKIQDPLQRNAAGIKVFGKGFVELGEFAQLGARGIDELRQRARELGIVISNETIARAKEAGDEFDTLGKVFTAAGVNIAVEFLPAIRAVLNIMTDPEFQSGIGTVADGLGKLIDTAAGGVGALSKLAEALGGISNIMKAFGGAAIPGLGIKQAFDDVAAATPQGQMRERFATSFPMKMQIMKFAPPKPTGGGYSAPDAEAQASADRVQKITDALKLQLEQLTQTDRQKAISTALSRADVDAKSAEATEIERLAGTLYDAEQAQKAFNDAASFAGDTIYDAIDGLILKGESFNDVLQNMVTRLAEAALQATLLGQGPLAGLFGTTSATGGVGGLLGALFSGFRAEGGPVTSGKGYVVGERGPELFVPRSSGMIRPNGAGQSSLSRIEVMIGVDPKTGNLTPFVKSVAGEVSVRTTQAGLGAYSKQQQRLRQTAG